MSTVKYRFTIYIAEASNESEYIRELRGILEQTLAPGSWALEVVNVLELPEKALKNDVFATPMLVREFPEPLIKVLGNALRLHDLLIAVTDTDTSSGTLL